MHHRMFQRSNVTHGLRIIVKSYVIRYDKVRNACYSMPVDCNHNNGIII